MTSNLWEVIEYSYICYGLNVTPRHLPRPQSHVEHLMPNVVVLEVSL